MLETVLATLGNRCGKAICCRLKAASKAEGMPTGIEGGDGGTRRSSVASVACFGLPRRGQPPLWQRGFFLVN